MAGSDGVPEARDGAAWRALVALQALPELLLGAQVRTSSLMEVEINGDLVGASDGRGFRAFAMDDNGIVEQSRLFEPSRLTALVDVALIWRLASIVVAQKYLADISATLRNIEKGISSISGFQRSELTTRVESALGYLRQVQAAVGEGERSQAVRNKLEHIDPDMDQIQRQLERMLDERLRERVIDKDTFGYASLEQGFTIKLQDLEGLLKEHRLATLTRIAALRSFSAFPGESILKQARAMAVNDASLRYKAFNERMRVELDAEVAGWSGGPEQSLGLVKVISTGVWNLAADKLGEPRLIVKSDEKGLTPILDAAKSAASEKNKALTLREIEAAAKLAKACTATDLIVLESSRVDKYLLSWRGGEIEWAKRLQSA